MRAAFAAPSVTPHPTIGQLARWFLPEAMNTQGCAFPGSFAAPLPNVVPPFVPAVGGGSSNHAFVITPRHRVATAGAMA